jgi:hypothetical protein
MICDIARDHWGATAKQGIGALAGLRLEALLNEALGIPSSRRE